MRRRLQWINYNGHHVQRHVWSLSVSRWVVVDGRKVNVMWDGACYKALTKR
jgi:hypothetical protein